jgi:anaerobic selenocysteine-containing dehydrogenase
MAYVTLDLNASRRRMLQSAAGLALGTLVLGAFGTPGSASAAAAKMPQKAVDYQTHPKAGHGCNTCKDFQPPQNCKTVESPVQASGWCNKYVHS